MNLREIRKGQEGKYLTRYDVVYTTRDGGEKIYEMFSRSKNMCTAADLKNQQTDSVVLVMQNEAKDRILLNREFRMAVGCWVYNFPGGLIDPGESETDTAARELMEETGLELVRLEDRLRDGYNAIGMSNEKSVVLFGVARGEIHNRPVFADEEIVSGWYSKAEVRQLLLTEDFAARTQAFCYMWSKE